MWRSRLSSLWSSERPFVIALVGAVVLRVLVQVAFPPAFVFSDGPTYLGFVDDLAPSPDRPIGYGILLWALSGLSRGVDLVAILQHVLGVLTAIVAYALLRRWRVRPRVAMLGVLPMLYDEMLLVLEHSVLSDTLFLLLVVAAVAVLAWNRSPHLWASTLAGLLIGLSAVVRLVGEPMVVVALVFVVAMATTWRARFAHAVALVVAFAIPVAAYAGWYHHDHGAWAITQSSGRALYMRTTTFVDCSKVTLPAYERPLCPAEPPGQRQDPTYYGWHDPAVLDLKTPAGLSQNDAMRDFAIRTIRAQPGAYAAVVGRDVAMAFWAPRRIDYYEYRTQAKWNFTHYVDYVSTPLWTRPAYAAHDGEMPSTRHPIADVLDWYGRSVYLPGPLLLVLLVLTAAGLVVRRPDRGRSTRPLALMLLALGLSLSIEPDVTAEFVWRYQAPLVILLPLAAALSWTRLRSQRGTTATPSTD